MQAYAIIAMNIFVPHKDIQLQYARKFSSGNRPGYGNKSYNCTGGRAWANITIARDYTRTHVIVITRAVGGASKVGWYRSSAMSESSCNSQESLVSRFREYCV